MAGFSATDLAIKIAKRDGHLVLVQRRGRFGEYVSIQDNQGTIEVADTMADAERRVKEVCQ